MNSTPGCDVVSSQLNSHPANLVMEYGLVTAGWALAQKKSPITARLNGELVWFRKEVGARNWLIMVVYRIQSG